VRAFSRPAACYVGGRGYTAAHAVSVEEENLVARPRVRENQRDEDWIMSTGYGRFGCPALICIARLDRDWRPHPTVK